MDPFTSALLVALLAVNLAWLLFISVQIRRALAALRYRDDLRAKDAAAERAHEEFLHRRKLEAFAQFECAVLTAMREFTTPQTATESS